MKRREFSEYLAALLITGSCFPAAASIKPSYLLSPQCLQQDFARLCGDVFHSEYAGQGIAFKLLDVQAASVRSNTQQFFLHFGSNSLLDLPEAIYSLQHAEMDYSLFLQPCTTQHADCAAMTATVNLDLA